MKKLLMLIIMCLFIFPINAKAATETSCIAKGVNVSFNIDVGEEISLKACNYISIHGDVYGVISYEPNDTVFQEITYNGISPINSKTFIGVGDGQFTVTIKFSVPTANLNVSKEVYSYVTVYVGAQLAPPIEMPEPSATPTPSTTPIPSPSTNPSPNPSNSPTPEPSMSTKSNNNYLSSLNIENYNLNQTFNKNITTYTVDIPDNITNIKVLATAEHEKATIKNIGNIDITNKSSIDVIVIAEDGSKKTYTIHINKKSTSNALLKSLSVEGYSLDKTFDPNILNYYITVPYQTTEINIKAIAANSKDNIQITGNDQLKVGNNTIEITVTNENGDFNKYRIIAIKQEQVINTPQYNNNNKSNLGLYIGIGTAIIAFSGFAAFSIIKKKRKKRNSI